MSLEVHVIGVLENGITGHYTFDLQVIETLPDGTEIRGLPERHGVQGLALARMHGANTPIADSLAQWLEKTKARMATNYRTHRAAGTEILKLIGKRLPVQE